MPDAEQPKVCRNCGCALERRQHRRPPRQKKNRLDGGYYFKWWWYCPSCQSIFHEEAAKTYFRPEIQKLRDDSLQAGLAKQGILDLDPITQEVHHRINEFLSDPSKSRKINNWESTFLVSLLKFQTFSQKQLNCLERIIGPLSYNRSLLDAVPVETKPPELPLQLEPSKKMMTCITCGREFELHPNKPGKINECIRCLIERQTGKAKAS